VATTTTTHPTYVYGVLDATDPPPQGTGIAGAPLHVITADGVTALVSELPTEQIRLGREEVTLHAEVLERALAGGPVLPMRFGVVMDGEAAVRIHLLQAHRDALRAQLENMKDKVELRIRAMYEEDALMREILQSSGDIKRVRDSLRGKSEDATYYDRIRLGEMVAEEVEQRREYDAAQMLERLSPLAVDVHVAAGGHERVALNASFLVEAPRVGDFDQAVDKIGRDQAGRMRIKYVGPLPPHSFVELGGREA
jgi:Gas vesicle synthesis protein GvpL/GvpF